MSITATPPEQQPSAPPPPQPSYLPRWIYFAFLVLLGGIGYLAYAGYNSRLQLTTDLAKADEKSEQLSMRLDQANARIAELRGQLEVTTGRLGLSQAELARVQSRAQEFEKEQEQSDTQLTAQIGKVQQESDTKIGQVANDLNGAKGDINATKQDLEATKSKLSKATGDIDNHSTLIAKNAEEVEELKRLGERNIYDFTLTKSKTAQRVGPVQLRLTSVDTKKYKYTVLVVADDKSVEHKDKAVDELWQFVVRGARTPYEVVVFEVGKDRVTGYLSTPKDAGSSTPPKPAS